MLVLVAGRHGYSIINSYTPFWNVGMNFPSKNYRSCWTVSWHDSTCASCLLGGIWERSL